LNARLSSSRAAENARDRGKELTSAFTEEDVMTSPQPHRLSDRELLERLEVLVKRERVGLVELLAHLAEVDARKLYLEQACPSMFVYCTQRLHFSESAAYHRITAARVARRFPIVLGKVRAGELHLSGLTVLAPHLTPENHLELLAAARHKSKRAIEVLVAELRPKPDMRTVVRCLPAAKPPESPSAPSPVQEKTIRPAPQIPSPHPSTPPRHPPAATQEPLGEQRYRLHLTLPSTTYEKLQEAQALMRHQLPDGDLVAVMDRALTLLLQEVKKRRFALTERPRQPREKTDCRPSSRHIPSEIRRQVFERDAGRCTYVDAQGRRCGAREFLEFHHVDSWARAHHHDPGRISLLCRPHNQQAAEVDYGRVLMGRKGGTKTDCPRGQSASGVKTIPGVQFIQPVKRAVP
jgi:hypothetical protein